MFLFLLQPIKDNKSFWLRNSWFNDINWATLCFCFFGGGLSCASCCLSCTFTCIMPLSISHLLDLNNGHKLVKEVIFAHFNWIFLIFFKHIYLFIFGVRICSNVWLAFDRGVIKVNLWEHICSKCHEMI